jgi:hypothetical protein
MGEFKQTTGKSHKPLTQIFAKDYQTPHKAPKKYFVILFITQIQKVKN